MTTQKSTTRRVSQLCEELNSSDQNTIAYEIILYIKNFLFNNFSFSHGCETVNTLKDN